MPATFSLMVSIFPVGADKKKKKKKDKKVSYALTNLSCRHCVTSLLRHYDEALCVLQHVPSDSINH